MSESDDLHAERLYVIIKQLQTDLEPVPRPLKHGFSENSAYLVLGGFSLSESAEALLMLANDKIEIWFISNRHLRAYQLRQLRPNATEFRLALPPVNRIGTRKPARRASSRA